jgi:hypothetical protein
MQEGYSIELEVAMLTCSQASKSKKIGEGAGGIKPILSVAGRFND